MGTKTWPEVLAYAMTFVTTPTPYVFGGEGDKPGEGTDCSRFMQVVQEWAGNPFTRTTETQFADATYRHFDPDVTPQAGWLCYLEVIGDQGDPPQHVGLCINATQYVNAPHTGADVRVEPIPNTAAESRWGFVAPPYASAPSPTPPPIPLPTKEEIMSTIALPDAQHPNRILITAVGAGTRAGQLLSFTIDDPTNPNAPGYNVIDVTAGIGGAAPYVVQSV